MINFTPACSINKQKADMTLDAFIHVNILSPTLSVNITSDSGRFNDAADRHFLLLLL